ncbi:MAG: type II toxin-antitoxin system Phd/YefM family antitoxin [Candidatus Thiosymbion ectosymbiont of Robbea hypermnestra]|nr:type II toxin-antitoxin system Phd/YefM family antitoxin [Candidatus Thiosymbion ectosymbiont of Robbea hypermnestra]
MLELHPSILEKDGRKAFAILTYEEFEQLSEELSNYQDLQDLRSAKYDEGEAPVLSLAEVRKQLNI